MDFIEKERIVHGYNEYVPFQVTDKVIELMEKIKNKTYDEEKLNIGMRELTSSEVLDYGKSFLNDFFNLHYINYLSKESRIKVTSSKMDPSLLCMLYGRLINPFDLPVRFVYNDVFAGDVDINYNFSNKLSVLKRMKIYFEKINLSKNNTIFNAAAYIHELVHTQVLKNPNTLTNFYNSEVLSIFIELVVSRTINKETFDNMMRYRFENVYECIVDLSYVGEYVYTFDKLTQFRCYLSSSLKALHLYDIYRNSSRERRIEILSLVEDVFRNQMTVEQFLDMMHITYDNSKDVGMVKHYVKKYK